MGRERAMVWADQLAGAWRDATKGRRYVFINLAGLAAGLALLATTLPCLPHQAGADRWPDEARRVY
jgi:hypothetical protein